GISRTKKRRADRPPLRIIVTPEDLVLLRGVLGLGLRGRRCCLAGGSGRVGGAGHPGHTSHSRHAGCAGRGHRARSVGAARRRHRARGVGRHRAAGAGHRGVRGRRGRGGRIRHSGLARGGFFLLARDGKQQGNNGQKGQKRFFHHVSSLMSLCVFCCFNSRVRSPLAACPHLLPHWMSTQSGRKLLDVLGVGAFTRRRRSTTPTEGRAQRVPRQKKTPRRSGAFFHFRVAAYGFLVSVFVVLVLTVV